MESKENGLDFNREVKKKAEVLRDNFEYDTFEKGTKNGKEDPQEEFRRKEENTEEKRLALKAYMLSLIHI